MHVLVTGAAGFVGAALTSRLLDDARLDDHSGRRCQDLEKHLVAGRQTLVGSQAGRAGGEAGAVVVVLRKREALLAGS